MVVISLKKDYMKRRELESVQVNSIHYSRLFLPPIKKYQNHAIRLTRLAGEVYHDDAPAFAAVLSSFNRFFIFPSKSWRKPGVKSSLLGTPLPEQLKAQDLPEDDASQYTWASRQNPYSSEPLSCFHRGRCYTLQVLALIWLNTVCNPL